MRGYGFFEDIAGQQQYKAGAIIFREGEIGDVLYVVVEGNVRVTLQGRLIDYLTPGTIFGEMALVDASPRSATTIAATDCTLLKVDHDRFRALVQKHPDFGLQVMTIMSVRMRRLMDEEVKRQRLEEEMAIGRQIQLTLLPENTPQIPGWEFAAAYQSARQVGGDLYDFIPVPDAPGCLNLVIADVTDKGVAAALFMAFSRTVLRVEAANGRSPAETLKHINRFILQDVRAKLFLSVFYATLNTSNGTLTYANGGHEKPLWLRASSGQIELLPASGLLLGVFGNVTWEQCEVKLAQDDCLIMFTDGITEARNGTGEMYGEERVAAVATAVFPATAQQLLDAIINDLEKFCGSVPQTDDFTLVIVKRVA